MFFDLGRRFGLISTFQTRYLGHPGIGKLQILRAASFGRFAQDDSVLYCKPLRLWVSRRFLEKLSRAFVRGKIVGILRFALNDGVVDMEIFYSHPSGAAIPTSQNRDVGHPLTSWVFGLEAG